MSLEEVTVAVSPAEKFREFLLTKGLRMTQERAKILEEVFASHEHFEAEQLVQKLAAHRVSRSTVYRTVKHLEESGLIRKVARQDSRDVYEHDYGYPQHDHLICKKCGTLIEFQQSTLANVLADVAKQHGFRMEGHRLEVFGLCDVCCRPPQTRPKKLNLL